jgi:hypothetical protein
MGRAEASIKPNKLIPAKTLFIFPDFKHNSDKKKFYVLLVFFSFPYPPSLPSAAVWTLRKVILLKESTRPSMPCFQVYLRCLMKGRILCLLSTCYPVSERSTVNQKGDFNVGIVTVYQEMAIGDDMDVDGQEDDKGKDKGFNGE